jgi:hypothetical protein
MLVKKDCLSSEKLKAVNPQFIYQQLLAKKSATIIEKSQKHLLQNEHIKEQTQQSNLLDLLLKPERQNEMINHSYCKRKNVNERIFTCNFLGLKVKWTPLFYLRLS